MKQNTVKVFSLCLLLPRLAAALSLFFSASLASLTLLLLSLPCAQVDSFADSLSLSRFLFPFRSPHPETHLSEWNNASSLAFYVSIGRVNFYTFFSLSLSLFYSPPPTTSFVSLAQITIPPAPQKVIKVITRNFSLRMSLINFYLISNVTSFNRSLQPPDSIRRISWASKQIY